MAESRKLVKVFLGSPGDVVEERRLAKWVVDEVNQLLGDEFGCQIELVGWEDTVSVFGRPQATINLELERCELFVGVMWKHWGSPPDVKGPYTSGFEEEFRTSVERRLKENRPEISLFFKDIDKDLVRDPGPSLQKVLDFKREITDGKQILYEAFTESKEFESRFRRCIVSYIKKLRDAEREGTNETSSPATEISTSSGDRTAPLTPRLFSEESTRFLRTFLDNSSTSDDASYSTSDVARFRLLGGLVGKSGNDSNVLGVHDNNSMFVASHEELTLDPSELDGLVRSGLRHYADENTPLWRWFAQTHGFQDNLLPFYSVHFSGDEQVAALRAMHFVRQPLSSNPQFDRAKFLSLWFNSDASTTLKAAALTYLGEFGIDEDLPIIRTEFEQNNYQTRKAASEAIIRIRLRESKHKAITALFELQPTSIDTGLLVTLFNNFEALPVPTLLEGVSHQSADVRFMTVDAINRKNCLSVELAQSLLADTDARVGLIAIESLVKAGHHYTEEQAQEILVRKNAGSGFFGLSDSVGTACFAKFKWQRWINSTGTELKEAASSRLALFDDEPYFISTERAFKKHALALRDNIDDDFEGYFDEKLKQLFHNSSADSDSMEKTKSLKSYLIKKLIQKGIELLCRRSEASDLTRIRDAIHTKITNFAQEMVEYLKKHGEWQDIPLIVKTAELPRSDSDTSLASSLAPPSVISICAAAMHVLAKGRLAELLAITTRPALLSALIVQSADKRFRELHDTSIMSFLLSDDVRVRRTSALKCVRALPKNRLHAILKTYVDGDGQRYYNVVHWLDFGASVPHERAVFAAAKALDGERFD